MVELATAVGGCGCSCGFRFVGAIARLLSRPGSSSQAEEIRGSDRDGLCGEISQNLLVLPDIRAGCGIPFTCA